MKAPKIPAYVYVIAALIEPWQEYLIWGMWQFPGAHCEWRCPWPREGQHTSLCELMHIRA